MDTILNTDIKNVIDNAEAYCSEEGIVIELVHKLPEGILEVISERSKSLPTLYFVSVELLRRRLKNGCFLMKNKEQVIGHIFAHEHYAKGHSVYERSSLWVDREYRNYNLGLLLMSRMTELYTGKFLISIAQTPKVHHYNELLGMTHIMLSEMSKVLVEELEKIGKLRDELNYKYFVNPCFELEIRQLK
jgi:GNAT superfamily N-acetyltransferase